MNDDLLRQASAISPDLAPVLERLLADHLERQAPRQREADAHVAVSNEFIDKHGFWGEDVCDL